MTISEYILPCCAQKAILIINMKDVVYRLSSHYKHLPFKQWTLIGSYCPLYLGGRYITVQFGILQVGRVGELNFDTIYKALVNERDNSIISTLFRADGKEAVSVLLETARIPHRRVYSRQYVSIYTKLFYGCAMSLLKAISSFPLVDWFMANV